MSGNLVLGLVLCLGFVQIAVSQQLDSSKNGTNNGTVVLVLSKPVNLSASVSLSTSAGVTTTVVPITTNPGNSVPSTSQNSTAKNATGTTDDEDCSGEDGGAPEPEGGAHNGTSLDRTGKQLELNDQDKYKHEHDGATAEPEPEGTASSAGHLSGNSSTPAPAHGSASTMVAMGLSSGLAAALTTSYLKFVTTNL